MPRYIIERHIPGAGRLSAEDLRGVAGRSCTVLRDLGPGIQWVTSYVTDDTIYCVYIAATEELVREHARRGGFPADRVTRVHREISPLTAESAE
jgi:hypothetical protein